ncbi:MAG: ImmA/IrrE family metallo-endopeptidase [Candidatus Thiodubiliella endoseptemdiera]|uniref:ImmA/IrrE family metallo-endopeptidase n=1 Tax=Candidatus Thiodubiliella endoseptemdiera TaxID=2738886 RepID=A0A853F373_9GAMM|nr:ImmA/IrrE family metallo-endopeptidase [Candidatus Thiodubiliella endoseptemdiera]
MSKIGNIDITEENMSASDFNGASFGSEENVKILINRNIDNHHRRRFTKAHELGHAILHILLANNRSFNVVIAILHTMVRIILNMKKANTFASSLLMPSKLIEKKFIEMTYLGN